MKRFFAAAVGAIALLAPAGAMAMDCDKEAQVRLDRMDPEEALSPEEATVGNRIMVSRFIVYGHTACKAGHHKAAQHLFNMASQYQGGSS